MRLRFLLPVAGISNEPIVMKRIQEIRPPNFALGFLFIGVLAHLTFSPPRIIPSSLKILGGILVIGGLVSIFWAGSLFQKRGTVFRPTEDPKVLVREGPYARTRNPMYLGAVLILSGIAILIGTLPLLLVPVAFFFVVQVVFIPYEERNLKRIFGKRYEDYQSRVRRWF